MSFCSLYNVTINVILDVPHMGINVKLKIHLWNSVFDNLLREYTQCMYIYP